MNLQNEAQEAYDIIKNIYNRVFETNQQNEQWFLDWLDNINEIVTSW